MGEVTNVAEGARMVEPARLVPREKLQPPVTEAQMKFFRQFGQNKGITGLDVIHTVDSKPRAVIGRSVEKAGVYLWNRYLHKIPFGLYPKEYNFKVHGFYQPWRYYGKPDTALGDVKLSELRAWYSRRNKSFGSFCASVGRAHARYVHKNMFAKFAHGGQAYFQFLFFIGLSGWIIHHGKTVHHKSFYYHW